MSRVHWNGAVLLAPVPPVLVSCGTKEAPNLITIGWCGVLNTHPPKTYISIRPSRHSYDLIKNSGEFVINLATSDLVRAVDFCGVRSGREIDKFAHCKLTPIDSKEVSAPSVAECPLSLECRLTEIVPLGTHDMFLADIVSVSVDEKLLDEKGKLHLARANLLAYAHGEYFKLGPQIGTFGFSVRKKPKNGRK